MGPEEITLLRVAQGRAPAAVTPPPHTADEWKDAAANESHMAHILLIHENA